MQNRRQVALLRVKRLGPGQLAVAMSGHIVSRVYAPQLFHYGQKSGNGAVDNRRVIDEQQIRQPESARLSVKHRHVVIRVRGRPGLHLNAPAAKIDLQNVLDQYCRLHDD